MPGTATTTMTTKVNGTARKGDIEVCSPRSEKPRAVPNPSDKMTKKDSKLNNQSPRRPSSFSSLNNSVYTTNVSSSSSSFRSNDYYSHDSSGPRANQRMSSGSANSNHDVVLIKVDNLPPRKNWKQVKYLIGGIIHHSNILKVKMLPPMAYAAPPFMTVQSCVVSLKGHMNSEMVNDLLGTLNTYQWDYYDLYAYMLPPWNTMLKRGSFSTPSNDNMANVSEGDLMPGANIPYNMSPMPPPPSGLGAYPMIPPFMPPNFPVGMDPNGVNQQPEPMSNGVRHEPMPVFDNEHLKPRRGSKPSALEEDGGRTESQGTNSPITPTLMSDVSQSPAGESPFSLMPMPDLGSQTGVPPPNFPMGMMGGPLPPPPSMLLPPQGMNGLQMNNMSPGFRRRYSYHQTGIPDYTRPVSSTTMPPYAMDQSMLPPGMESELFKRNTNPFKQPKKLKNIFNERNFRKQMTDRGMWQLKLTNFPPYLLPETQTLIPGDHTNLEVDITTDNVNKFGKLRWTVLKDFIKLKCPKLLNLQDIGLGNGASHPPHGENTREFYVGVYEEDEQNMVIDLQGREDGMDGVFQMESIIYSAVIGFHNKELSDLCFKILQGQEYSLGYRLEVEELPPYDENNEDGGVLNETLRKLSIDQQHT
ncbi:uncharacterized protein KNAG_0D01590 [Huiozyma naganishii CBS 8797]|uniref:Uncharacterized protein n=1 Tax=Huiozyma naganishii (strain ATCC MYA-139 / BCRC 22969 / CBS 8797 / KCTC 17520 / NBRC 10181 / NCYC 3082 / Yp74L-3) TaxID=1071383 RepID=J7S6R2_HUIN7|nr:hypothetical protein KNAG_0D01590 [Kazachstania naganishii CBS 8797]CCK69911.1 hypothetical protein KNAG_0D01590 [Kazachstania naganishii CBS 8797]